MIEVTGQLTPMGSEQDWKDFHEGAALTRAQIDHNLLILGAGLSAGMSVEQLAPLCYQTRPEPTPKVLTDLDKQRLAEAEAKRQRKAQKRMRDNT